jgi:hypothetical protein
MRLRRPTGITCRQLSCAGTYASSKTLQMGKSSNGNNTQLDTSHSPHTQAALEGVRELDCGPGPSLTRRVGNADSTNPTRQRGQCRIRHLNSRTYPSSAWAHSFHKVRFPCLLQAMERVLWSREAGASGNCVPKETLGTRCILRTAERQVSPSKKCLTELGGSGQRRLSVGGAMTASGAGRWKFSRAREATGTRKAARGCAATVGFRRANRRRRSRGYPLCGCAAVGTDKRQTRSGKNFRDCRMCRMLPTG